MSRVLKKALKTFIFIIAGAFVGLGYYYLFGCSSGICVITSSPWSTMAYTAVIGALLSVLFKKECKQCNT